MTQLDIALSYIACDWPVFPCRSKEEFDDLTGEVFQPKTPLTSNGWRGATKSERIVKEWFGIRYPDALVACPTGEAMRAWVLDVDVKPGVGNGFDWLEQMEDLHGPLPDTATVETPRGGRHYYFKHVDGIKNRGNLGHCIDVRGSGGFVVLAGSKMENGRTYEWIDHDGDGIPPIADAPDWLLEMVLPRKYEPVIVPSYHSESATPSEIEDLLTYVSPDCGYHDWVNVLMAIHSTLGDEGLHIADAWSSGSGKHKHGEVARKWRGFKGGGVGLGSLCELARQGGADLSAISRKHNGSVDSTPVDNTTLESINRIIRNGLAKKHAAPVRDAGAPTEAPLAEVTPNGVTSVGAPATAQADNDNGPIKATPFKWIDPRKLPRREFAFGTHYIRKYVSVTVSPGGLGKTSNSIVEALAMASGRALTGIKPPQRMRVWLFNAEDPRDEMERRIMGACLHYKLKPEDIEGYLFLDTGREQELVVAKDDKKAGLKIVEPVVEAIVGQIERCQIDVMVIDPFVSTHRVNENDNGAIDAVAKLWAQIADRTNCAVDVVHHLKKVSDREATVEDSRGAVSLIGAARSVRVLNRMGMDVAAKHGISDNDALSYFSIHQGKANLTKMSANRDWRKLESVPLGNGKGLAMPQDHAGVVTEWSVPTNDEIAAAVPDDVKQGVIITLGNRNYRESPQSDEWAGYVLAEALGMDVQIDRKMTPEKKKAKAVLDAWIENGTLKVAVESDPKHIDRTIKFIRPREAA